MTVDEAVRELLAVSPDIRQAVVLDPAAAPPAEGADAAPPGLAGAAGELWQAAGAAAGAAAAPLEHVVVELDGATVIVVEARGRRIAALAAPGTPLGLALFDLRTCLADAFPEEEPA